MMFGIQWIINLYNEDREYAKIKTEKYKALEESIRQKEQQRLYDAEADLKEHQRLYENTQSILREFGADTAEIIPGIESPIEKTMTFNDYCERIRVSQEKKESPVDPTSNSYHNMWLARRKAQEDLYMWPGNDVKINSKIKIRFPDDYVKVQEEYNKNYGCSQDLKHKQKIINAVWIVLTKRPWLAYRECEDIANEILAELNK